MDEKEYDNLKDLIKRIKYRWEFMRRSPEYKEDYRKVQELRKRGIYSPEDLDSYFVTLQ